MTELKPCPFCGKKQYEGKHHMAILGLACLLCAFMLVATIARLDLREKVNLVCKGQIWCFLLMGIKTQKRVGTGGLEMTDEAKRCVEALRICHLNEDCRDCEFVDSYKGEMSCVNVLFVKSASLIESLSDKNKQLEYTLIGVMHFVDKWLDDIEPYSLVDDPSGQIAIDRAAEARRITLEHIEDLTREMYRRGQELSEVQRERDAVVEDIPKATIYLCSVCKSYRSAAKGEYEHYCEKFGKHPDFNGAIACSMFEWRGPQEEV